MMGAVPQTRKHSRPFPAQGNPRAPIPALPILPPWDRCFILYNQSESARCRWPRVGARYARTGLYEIPCRIPVAIGLADAGRVPSGRRIAAAPASPSRCYRTDTTGSKRSTRPWRRPTSGLDPSVEPNGFLPQWPFAARAHPGSHGVAERLPRVKGRVGGVVTEPLPPQSRACAIDALGSSPDRFAQEACHERVIVTGGRGYRLRSSFIRSQFKPRRRLRRESHIRQMRATW